MLYRQRVILYCWWSPFLFQPLPLGLYVSELHLDNCVVHLGWKLLFWSFEAEFFSFFFHRCFLIILHLSQAFLFFFWVFVWFVLCLIFVFDGSVSGARFLQIARKTPCCCGDRRCAWVWHHLVLKWQSKGLRFAVVVREHSDRGLRVPCGQTSTCTWGCFFFPLEAVWVLFFFVLFFWFLAWIISGVTVWFENLLWCSPGCQKPCGPCTLSAGWLF